MAQEPKTSELIIYTTEDGLSKVDVRFDGDTVWMSLDEMSQLFEKAKSTISEHVKNIYAEGELNEENTLRKFGISEFSTKPTNFYNLDMIISVGYRVKSRRVRQRKPFAGNAKSRSGIQEIQKPRYKQCRTGLYKQFEAVRKQSQTKK